MTISHSMHNNAHISDFDDAPVDLVYLSTFSMGDASLETEVLRMFAVQLPTYLTSFMNCENSNERRVALHTLKGAARSVGAIRLSSLAKQLEDEPEISVAGLLEESARVVKFIDQLSL